MLTVIDRRQDHVAEQFALAIFGDQKRIQCVISTERFDDVMWISGQPGW